MTKSRDILKGKVKRLLREQEDMGMLCDPAVQHCVSALEAFVHDMGRRLKAQAETAGAETVTPVELKRAVLESEDLAFLHDKVQVIDESNAKYHKTPRKRKAPAAKASTAKKTKAKGTTEQTSELKATAAAEATVSKPGPSGATSGSASNSTAALSAMIDEDDNYDSSDSE